MTEILLVAINSGVLSTMTGYIVLSIYDFFFSQLHRSKIISVAFIRHAPIWLIAFSGLLYGLASTILRGHLTYNLFLYCIIPALVFATGYTITSNLGDDSILLAERCLAAIAIGCSIHVILNISVNSGLTNRSETADFFAGHLAATNLGSLNTYILALLPCLIITPKKKVKIIGLILFTLSVIYAFILGTRTTIYALIIMTVISAILYIKKHYPNGIPVNRLIKWAIIICALIFIAQVVYSNNFLNIKTNIETSTLLRRFNAIETTNSDIARMGFLMDGIVYLFEHPLGGNKIQGLNYFHNYWLDVGRIAGIVPVLLLVVLDITLFRHMLKVFMNKKIDEDFRFALLGIYICVLINFFMEPIMDGYLDLFFRFTFINGMVEGIYIKFNRPITV